MAILSGGRFTLGVGAGERLNEHVTGRPFPSVRKHHEVLREALEIIRLLWRGGYQSDTAARAVVQNSRWARTGWKVMSELPNPANFAAATTTVTTDDVKPLRALVPRTGKTAEGG